MCSNIYAFHLEHSGWLVRRVTPKQPQRTCGWFVASEGDVQL